MTFKTALAYFSIMEINGRKVFFRGSAEMGVVKSMIPPVPEIGKPLKVTFGNDDSNEFETFITAPIIKD